MRVRANVSPRHIGLLGIFTTIMDKYFVRSPADLGFDDSWTGTDD
jgi:hypothetical protein